jgi:hypothetical protein
MAWIAPGIISETKLSRKIWEEIEKGVIPVWCSTWFGLSEKNDSVGVGGPLPGERAGMERNG